MFADPLQGVFCQLLQDFRITQTQLGLLRSRHGGILRAGQRTPRRIREPPGVLGEIPLRRQEFAEGVHESQNIVVPSPRFRLLLVAAIFFQDRGKLRVVTGRSRKMFPVRKFRDIAHILRGNGKIRDPGNEAIGRCPPPATDAVFEKLKDRIEGSPRPPAGQNQIAVDGLDQNAVMTQPGPIGLWQEFFRPPSCAHNDLRRVNGNFVFIADGKIRPGDRIEIFLQLGRRRALCRNGIGWHGDGKKSLACFGERHLTGAELRQTSMDQQEGRCHPENTAGDGANSLHKIMGCGWNIVTTHSSPGGFA